MRQAASSIGNPNLRASRRLADSLVITWLVWAAVAYAETLEGRVVSIADGDTITVLDDKKHQHKIRLAAIDAPGKAQPFGARAKQNLSDLVYDKTVAVDYKKYDRYGRIIGKVMVAPANACPAVRHDCPKTLDTGLAQITVGLAWHHNQYENEQTEEDRERYAFAEKEARAKRVGLWRDPHPVSPWQWRTKKDSRK